MSLLSRGSMLKYKKHYFKEFYGCTEPRLKWNKITLAAKIILFYVRRGSVPHENSLK